MAWYDRFRLSGVLLIGTLVVFWQLSAAYKWIDSPSWPPVSVVLAHWWQMLAHGDLILNVAMSLRRMFIGYAIGGLIGVTVGLLMGFYRPIYHLLEPLTEMLRPIPSPAYIPIAILFLGIDDQMKVFMIALPCFFPILLNTYSGVRSVDSVQINTGRTFGLTRRKILSQIILPAATPYIFTGLRISLGIALILAVISEMVAANDGIGYLILHTQRSFQVAEMYAGVMTLALVGYGLNRLFLWIERRLIFWHHMAGTH